MNFQMFKLVLEKAEEKKKKERKGRGTRDHIANISWTIKIAREFQKNIYFCFIDYAKAFDCVDHNKLENSEGGENIRPPYLTREKSVFRSRSNS